MFVSVNIRIFISQYDTFNSCLKLHHTTRQSVSLVTGTTEVTALNLRRRFCVECTLQESIARLRNVTFTDALTVPLSAFLGPQLHSN
jgi:hypothetical protein